MHKVSINTLNLKPADRVIIPKSGLGLIQHHGIYLGLDSRMRAVFAENNIVKGVQIVTSDDFFRNVSSVTGVKRFIGNEIQRYNAVNFALSLRGKEYDLLNFNCEHYSNLIQHGFSKSEQVENGLFLGLCAAVIGGLLMID